MAKGISMSDKKNEIDAEIERLENELAIVAQGYRGCFSDECAKELTAKYHAIMKRLFELGWREKLYLEDNLPWNLMPKQYRLLHPNPGQAQFFNEDDYYTPPEIEYTPLKLEPTSAIEIFFQRIISFFKRR